MSGFVFIQWLYKKQQQTTKQKAPAEIHRQLLNKKYIVHYFPHSHFVLYVFMYVSIIHYTVST